MTEIGCDPNGVVHFPQGAVAVFCTSASLISPLRHGKMFHYTLRSHDQNFDCNGLHFGCGPTLNAGQEIFGLFYHFNGYKYSKRDQCSKIGSSCEFNMTREDTSLKDIVYSAISVAARQLATIL